MSKKPKIALLTIRNNYKYGGVFSVLKIAYQFCEKYFDPTVFFLGFDKEISASIRGLKFHSTTRPVTYFGMNCIEIGARWAFWEPGHYAFTIGEWKKALAQYDYFFVVSATPIAAHPLVQLNKKFSLWMSTPYLQDRTERIKELKHFFYLLSKITSPSMHKIEKTILEKASFIWAMSKYSKEQCEAILEKPKENMAICGYPIDLKKITKRIPSKQKIIISVARFSDPRKNITLLLNVFDKLYHKLPDIKLYVIGQQPLPEKVAPFISRPSYQNIVFTGQISQTELNHFYQKASLMLITSYQEGFGIAGLEALANGIPIVATNCGGIKDFVINDLTGYVVDLANEQDMVEKAYLVLTDEELYKKMAQAAKIIVEENFSLEKIHALLKHGLLVIYPELKALFTEYDNLHEHKVMRNSNHENINY